MDAEALADALADAAAVLAEPPAEALADADAAEEDWEELELHALSPRAAAGTTPSSRVRRLRGEVMVVPLYQWMAADLWLGRVKTLSAAVGIGFIVCLCPEHSLSSDGCAG